MIELKSLPRVGRLLRLEVRGLIYIYTSANTIPNRCIKSGCKKGSSPDNYALRAGLILSSVFLDIKATAKL